jgi:ABC-type branched-subunit amino acid transport system permease subunit
MGKEKISLKRIIRIFDFQYYIFYWLATHKIPESAAFYASAITGLGLSMLAGIVLSCFCLILKKTYLLFNNEQILVLVFSWAFSFFYFYRRDYYKKIVRIYSKKWIQEKEQKRIQIVVLVVLWLIFLLAMFYFCAYRIGLTQKI